MADDATPVPPPADPETRARGQRRINLVWESTQAAIAVAVCGSTLFVAVSLGLAQGDAGPSFQLLGNGFFLVTGFYFGSRLSRSDRATDATR